MIGYDETPQAYKARLQTALADKTLTAAQRKNIRARIKHLNEIIKSNNPTEK